MFPPLSVILDYSIEFRDDGVCNYCVWQEIKLNLFVSSPARTGIAENRARC